MKKILLLACLLLLVGCAKQAYSVPNKDKVVLSDMKNTINELPGIDGYQYNPQKLIRAVNILEKYSKDEILRILKTCKTAPERIYLVSYVIFIPEENNGMLPKLYLGMPTINIEETDIKQWPIFPLVLEEGIPFLLVAGYTLMGSTGDLSEQLDNFKECCKIRERPLTPSLNPLVAADNFIKSERWRNLLEKNGKEADIEYHSMILRIQALRMVGSVYPVLRDEIRTSYNNDINDAAWQKHLDNFSKLNVVWDPVINDYKIK